MLALFAAASGEQSTTYIEQVFSTYLYTGNGSTQTIINNIDLAGDGGMVWIKGRSGATGHRLTDTTRGATKSLASETTAAEATESTGLTAFAATGFAIGADADYNTSAATYVSWTFQEQPKFFDVVTYTGTGSNTTIAHNLDSVPGCIIVKRTDTTADWAVYHRSLANTQYLVLNSTAAAATGATWWNSTTPTSTVFSVGTDASVNASGGTYVAYLFAHDAGGFGLTGTDNVITCGSFTNDGSGLATVNLGYEPQFLLTKRTSSTAVWRILDTMRGFPAPSSGNCRDLYPNNTDIETSNNIQTVTSTGFNHIGGDASATYIYIAIRRGLMEIPTVGTTVFNPTSTSGTTGTQITTNFPLDWQILGINAGNVSNQRVSTRLTGVNTDGTSNSNFIITSSTAAEAATASLTLNWGSTGFQVPSLNSGSPIITWNFQRASGYFDVVCYTGTGSNTTQAHNLGVVPELIIVKRRDTTADWDTYCSALANTEYVVLNTTAAKATGATRWNSTTPTASVFSIGTSTTTNASAGTYVAYLFASCLGVSKVGSYTGTATTQQINCNFTTGARFVLIKRTDSTGDWYVWDSARGIIAGNDPYLLLNSTAAEVTSTDYVDAYAAGFELTSTAPAAINANGGTYIFLAIA